MAPNPKNDDDDDRVLLIEDEAAEPADCSGPTEDDVEVRWCVRAVNLEQG